jgi:hypothetical protein
MTCWEQFRKTSSSADAALLIARGRWRKGGATMLAAIRSGRTLPKSFALALVACALMLRMIVPAGWMPASNAHGFGITICTGMGPMEMPAIGMTQMSAMPEMHGTPDADEHQGSDHSCVFADLGLAITAPPALNVALPSIVRAAALVAILPAVSIGRGLAAPPPPATGPPLLA